MRFSFRPTQPQDLKNCFLLMREKSFYPKSDQTRLFSFWNYLFKERLAISGVVEDLDRPAGEKISSFGLSFFVTDEFAADIQATLPPPACRRVFEAWLKGRRVFLNRKEIARHNSGKGLNLMTIHSGREQRPPAEFMALNAKFIEGFFAFHSGYQIKEFLTENYSPEETAITLSHGLILRRTFSEYSPNGSKAFPHSLVGARKEDFNSPQNMYAFSLLFSCPPPRFGFTAGEKDLLEKSLLGETDQETARSLHLSIWAIKKRWQGIYEKVEKTNTSLFTPKDSGNSDDNQKVERRRFLLDYLRTHLEEVRPTLKVGKKRK